MKYRRLGTTDLNVSRICLGSMTWGTQNTESEGHRQIEIALDAGVNFIDTAELYPVNPARAETAGLTESYIGNWLEKTGRRNELVIATKLSGAGQVTRGGEPITPATIRACVAASLRRLKTDVIDLFQLHVPNRGSYAFRRSWTYDPSGQDREAVRANMEEVSAALAAEVKAGRIRYVGLSNETTWGLMAWHKAAEAVGGPRMQTVQNEYSLLARHFDLDFAEAAHHERVDLLAYSPVACGLLTGKYLNGQIPEGSRLALNGDLGGRVTKAMWPAMEAYVGIAHKHGLDPAQMALAFVLSRPFMGAAIIGGTADAHIRNAIEADNLVLSPEVFADIEAAHRLHGMPF